MADRVLVDSSALIEAMRKRGDEKTREEVDRVLRAGHAVLCHYVRLEIWNGVQGEPERKWLREIEATVETVETTEEVWRLAIVLAQQCRQQGVTVPSSDLLIAACARHYGLELLHRDGHFDLIAELAGNSY